MLFCGSDEILINRMKVNFLIRMRVCLAIVLTPKLGKSCRIGFHAGNDLFGPGCIRRTDYDRMPAFIFS